MTEQNIPRAGAFSARHQSGRKSPEVRRPGKALLFLHPTKEDALAAAAARWSPEPHSSQDPEHSGWLYPEPRFWMNQKQLQTLQLPLYNAAEGFCFLEREPDLS
ncbi:hypothetical protein [Desulfotignum phosphitoxidans]|uniref:hypothetical protein n=1 Tax=Desulfotignum phosphitoxidans TaxID=190898 RepID=UPI001360B459|nr:hypothetical protein [Desulfotignum phosphitoxidans]